MDRRRFLLLGAGAGLSAGAGFLGWRARDDGATPPTTIAGTTLPPTSRTTLPVDYGDLGPPDALGIQLPKGFSARRLATTGAEVEGTGHTWHDAPDGGACFPAPTGGWVYVSNSESVFGGAGALRFNRSGEVVDAYRILRGTTANCAGGPTPWGTWLSCEEHPTGQVWECDPLGRNEAMARPAMGAFVHEAAACDPVGEVVYLTEDTSSGKLRRFRPATWGDLSEGELEAAVVDGETVTWTADIEAATPFNGGEGAWYGEGLVWFTTKGDGRVWELDVSSDPNRLRVLYDDDTSPEPILTGVDNIVGAANGDLYIAEDGGNMEMVRLEPSGRISAFLRVQNQHLSELTGPAFSPDGSRFYFSSQRGVHGAGITYEVTGPFAT